MGTKMKVKAATESKPIPADLYSAKMSGYKLDTGNFGDFVKLEFEIISGTYAGTKRMVVASKKFTRGSKGSSKLLEIFEVLTGKKLSQEDEIDLDEMTGKTCRIVVDEPLMKDGMPFQKVSKVLPQAA